MSKGSKGRTVRLLALARSTVPLWILLLAIPSVFAQTSLQPFSATVIRVIDQKTSAGRIYATKNAVRTELKGDREESITVLRLDRNELDFLQSARKTNIQVPYTDDTGKSEPEFAGYLPGAETHRKLIGRGQIGPYHCDKYLVQVTYKGHVYSLIEWAAKKLNGFVVRREGQQNEWSSEYSNVRLGQQDPMLFEVPADYTTIKYSRDWTGIIQQLFMATPNTSEAAAIARTAGLEVTGDDPGFSENGASQPSADHYFATFVDPITKAEVLNMSTIVDRFPSPGASPSAPSGDPLTRENVTVRQSDEGSYYLLDVSFAIPDVSDLRFDTIKIYGMQIIENQRSNDMSYPWIHGSWQPKETVEFSGRVLKENADPSLGWNLTFCVGSATACYPSPNLLTLITRNEK
jgi:hypothetical protein